MSKYRVIYLEKVWSYYDVEAEDIEAAEEADSTDVDIRELEREFIDIVTVDIIEELEEETLTDIII